MGLTRTLPLTAIALVGWLSATGSLQGVPDFSGQWTEATEPAPPAAPASGAPAAPPRGDIGQRLGLARITITQSAGQLVVERARSSAATTSSRRSGSSTRLTIQSRNAVMLGHATQVRVSRAAWDGQALRITTAFPSMNPASGRQFTTEVAQRLSLESPATLVVEVTRGAALGGQTTTTRTVATGRALSSNPWASCPPAPAMAAKGEPRYRPARGSRNAAISSPLRTSRTPPTSTG